MRQAAAEHAHLELGRARTEVVAGEVGAAIANDLKVSDTAAAADALVVHRNTVTYRLGRIEQLTGRSLRDNRVRLELELALTIREIVQTETPG